MIFDSRRKQTASHEAEATTLAEEPRAGRTVAPDDVQTPTRSAGRPLDQEVYQPGDETVVDRTNTGVDDRPTRRSDTEDLEPLFSTDAAADFRHGWDAVQIGFVDDPRKAVKDADDLVNRVLQNLGETFKGERARIEEQVAQSHPMSTEELRVALRRYRSFLHRLLSL